MTAKNPNVQKKKTNNDVDRWTDNSNQFEKMDLTENEKPNSVFHPKTKKSDNRSKSK